MYSARREDRNARKRSDACSGIIITLCFTRCFRVKRQRRNLELLSRGFCLLFFLVTEDTHCTWNNRRNHVQLWFLQGSQEGPSWIRTKAEISSTDTQWCVAAAAWLYNNKIDFLLLPVISKLLVVVVAMLPPSALRTFWNGVLLLLARQVIVSCCIRDPSYITCTTVVCYFGPRSERSWMALGPNLAG